MLRKSEKIIASLDRLPIDTVRAAWIARVRAETGRLDALELALVDSGMERVETSAPITGDGREVIFVRGRAYALRPELHAARKTAAFSRAKKVERQEDSTPGEALSSVRCPSCMSAMAKQLVCPKCAKGKAGFKILCVCTECGHEVYL